MFKKLISASLIYAVAPQIPKLVGLFMTPLLTQHMTASDYGIASMIMAYTLGLDVIRDLGLRMNFASSFFRYRSRYKWIWAKLYGLIQLWSFFYAFALALLVYFILPDSESDNYWFLVILIALPAVFFDSTVMVGREFFQLSKKPIPYTIISIFASLLAVLVNYISIVNYRMGYLGLFLSSASSTLFLGLFFGIFVTFRLKIVPDFRITGQWIKRKLKISLPTVPHFFSGYIINVADKVILNLLSVPISDIGKYSFAYGIGSYFAIVGKSFNQASGPYYMECYQDKNLEGEIRAAKISRFFQINMLLAAFLLSIFSKEIFEILCRNEDLKFSFPIAIIVFFSYTYFPSYSFNSMKIWYTGKTKLLMKVSFYSAILSVLLNFLLVPFFGYFGSALATFFSMMYMGYGGFLNREIMGLFQVKYHWRGFIIITLALLCSSMILVEIDFFFKLVILLFSLIVLITFGKGLVKNILTGK